MSFRLGGTNPLSYIGVEPLTPPALLIIPRSPTQNDLKNINVGTFWLVSGQSVVNEELWILINAAGGIATWVQLYPNNNAGATQFPTDIGTANEAGGILNILGDGQNIVTSGTGNTVTVALGASIFLPNTVSGGSQGVYYINSIPFLHKFGGTFNAFGGGSGNLTVVTGNGNTGFGSGSLTSLTSGTSNEAFGNGALNQVTTGLRNTAIGSASLDALTTSSGNVAVGFNTLTNLVTGDNNIAIGGFSGSALISAESSNILIGNIGVNGDDNIIRIGTEGGGAGEQDQCYIAGIYNHPVSLPNQQVFIDANGKLGTVDGSSAAIPQFLAFLPSNDGPYTNSATFRELGVNVILTEEIDTTASFFPGDGMGSPALFTAPSDGVYQFNFGGTVSFAGDATVMQIIINATSRTFVLDFISSATGTTRSLTLSVCIPMTVGDGATFGFVGNTSDGAGWNIVGAAALVTRTWISGFKII